MLGSDFVGNFNSLLKIVCNDNLAVGIDRSSCDFCSGKKRNLLLEFLADCISEFFAVCNENCACKLIVFSL